MRHSDYSDLFEIRMLGVMAAAFQVSGIEPNDSQWAFLRGEREATLRDISDIGFHTSVNFEFIFSPIPKLNETE